MRPDLSLRVRMRLVNVVFLWGDGDRDLLRLHGRVAGAALHYMSYPKETAKLIEEAATSAHVNE